MSTNLVFGAELLCTKCKKNAEVSLFMASSDNICHVMANGLMPGNRENREVWKDIIPYTECKKNVPCDGLIETAPLWDNLTMPFGEIKVPHINWWPIFSWNVVKNLNSPADERDFRNNYDKAKRDNTGVGRGGYKFSDEELRHNANIEIYKKSGDPPNASLNMDSILLCLGFGGIIHPQTDGQSTICGVDLFEWILALPADQISDNAYTKLAEIFLYELEDLDKQATFISLCFDFKERLESNFIMKLSGLMPTSYHNSDKWQANSEKFDKLLEFMNGFALLEHNALKDMKGSPDFDNYAAEYLDNLHKILLFDSAQYIRNPASEIGASGPSIKIDLETTPFYNAHGGRTYNYPITSYSLSYENVTFLSEKVMLIGGSGDQIWRFPEEVTVYRPAESYGSGLMNLNALMTNNGYDMLRPSGFSGVPGAIRDETLAIITDFVIKEVPTALTHTLGVVTSAADIMNDIVEARRVNQLIDSRNSINQYLNVCDHEGFAGGVVIYTDPKIDPLLRSFSMDR